MPESLSAENRLGMDVAPAPAVSGGHGEMAATLIIGAMFFIFGFVTWLNGPLITFVKLAFTLTDFEAFLVPMVFYISYLVLALPSAAILRRTGLKRGMVLGLLVMAVGAAIFGHFSTMRIFAGALAGLFTIGGGLALLQTAANPYITILGPIDSAARRIAVMGICSKTAGLIAPIVFGALVMQGVGSLADRVAAADPAQSQALLDAFAVKVHAPYMGMAALLALLALAVRFSPLPELSGQGDEREGAAPANGRQDWRELRRFRHLWLGVVCMFAYVGVEVMAGDAIGLYGEALGLPIDQTAYFTSLTLAAMLAGYVAGLVAIPRFIGQESYLAWSAVFGLVMLAAATLTGGYVSVACIAILGFAHAMMWPTIFPLAIRGLGRHTETGSAIVIMGISGGAIFPQVYALLKTAIDFQLAFLVVMAPAYLYIFHYAVRGYRTR